MAPENAFRTTLSNSRHRRRGFGNGIVPDSLNPYPLPIQTWTASNYLMDIHLSLGHPLMLEAVRNMESTMSVNGFCSATFPNNNDYPRFNLSEGK